VHLVWATLGRESLLSRVAAARASIWLKQYSEEKGICMKICRFNADHVHALIDLPTNRCLEEVLHLFKGASSHWINEEKLTPGRFAWGRGYGAFSVSESAVAVVTAYIANQEEHHRKRSFAEEFQRFVERYGLEWRGLETVETVSVAKADADHPAKAGC
jgi:REP element-mobilizing transposase RayT